MGVSFTFAAGPRQRSHSQVWVPWDSSHFTPNLEGQVLIFLSPRKKVARLYPQALGSLSVASYDSQGYGGGIRPRLHTEVSNWVAQIIFLIITLHWPSTRHHYKGNYIVVFVFVAAGTCLPTRCLETGCITPLFIRLLHSQRLYTLQYIYIAVQGLSEYPHCLR
jgi:hypothetical protein